MPTDLHEVARVVRDATSVTDGIAELTAIAHRSVPADHAVWAALAMPLEWESDVAVVRAALEDRLRGCVPREATGIYLGIDGLNMPRGKGIEIGSSSEYVAGSADIDYIYRCDTYCEEIPFPALARFYVWFYGTPDQEEGFGHETFDDGTADALDIEHPLCLGAAALVFRDALRGLPPGAACGAAVERCFAFGFHDGDILRLGRATPAGGFVCDAAVV